MKLSPRTTAVVSTLFLLSSARLEAAVPNVLPPQDSPASMEVIPIRDQDVIKKARKAAQDEKALAEDLAQSASEAKKAAENAMEIAKAEIDARKASLSLAKKKDDDRAADRLEQELRVAKAKLAVLEHVVQMRGSEIDWAKQVAQTRALEIEMMVDEASLADDRTRLDELFERGIDAKITKKIVKLEEQLWKARKKLLEKAEKHAKAQQQSAKRRKDLVGDRIDILKEQRDLLDEEKKL